jgi:hypothetical protein
VRAVEDEEHYRGLVSFGELHGAEEGTSDGRQRDRNLDRDRVRKTERLREVCDKESHHETIQRIAVSGTRW